MELKKAYYYLICLGALLVFLWGVIDLSGSLAGALLSRPTTQAVNLPIEKEGEQSMDIYYQKKILFDRISDSLARILVAGTVFTFCRLKINRLEREG